MRQGMVVLLGLLVAVWSSGVAPAQPSPAPVYTGLIIDARHLRIVRDMSPRILVAGAPAPGRVVYPDPRHLLGPDELNERGMVGYATVEQQAVRAGTRPFRVRAVAATGTVSQDLIVSLEDADRILEANRSGRFIERQAVVILKSP